MPPKPLPLLQCFNSLQSVWSPWLPNQQMQRYLHLQPMLGEPPYLSSQVYSQRIPWQFSVHSHTLPNCQLWQQSLFLHTPGLPRKTGSKRTYWTYKGVDKRRTDDLGAFAIPSVGYTTTFIGHCRIPSDRRSKVFSFKSSWFYSPPVWVYISVKFLLITLWVERCAASSLDMLRASMLVDLFKRIYCTLQVQME